MDFGSGFFDDKETMQSEEREYALFARLPNFLADTMARLPALSQWLGAVDTRSVCNREALSALPVMRKDDLMELQSLCPPFGGLADLAQMKGSRIFMSPGPVFEPQGIGIDPYRSARALHAAGFEAGDIVHCSIGFQVTPGGVIFDEGIRALGAITFPAGVGNTQGQVQSALHIKPVAYAGTPDFLQVLLDRAHEMGAPIKSFKKAAVSGGALFPAMRQAYGDQGIRVTQSYATADMGVIAYETWNGDDLCEGMVVNEDLIVEIVRPGTGDPVPEGEVGEVVVTPFNGIYPLIRFGTGDLSKFLPGASPCGRTNKRIAGWMGRADQRTKIKGMFIDPKQIGELVRTVDGLQKARLVVTRYNNADIMTLQAMGEGLDAIHVQNRLKDIAGLEGEVQIVDSLPNDGKIIEDQRDYET